MFMMEGKTNPNPELSQMRKKSKLGINTSISDMRNIGGFNVFGADEDATPSPVSIPVSGCSSCNKKQRVNT